MDKKKLLLHPRSVVVISAVFAVLVLIGAVATYLQTSVPVSVAWEPLSGPVRSFVWTIARHPDHPDWLYAGTNGGGVYLSRDNGATWEQKARGLTSFTGETQGIEPALYARDILFSRLYWGVTCLATWGSGIYCSGNDGELWELQRQIIVNDPTPDLISGSMHVRVLVETQQDMFAGTKAGVMRLVDLASGFWEPAGLRGKEIRALLVHPDDPRTLYAATRGDGIYKITYQEGEFAWAWEAKNNGLDDGALIVEALIFDPADPDVLYAGTFGRGVYRSDDAGESWQAWAEGLPDQAEVWSLQFAADGTVFAGLRYGGTYKRVPGAVEWQKAELPYGALTWMADGETLYAGTWGVEHDGVVSGGLFRNVTGLDTSPEAWENLGLPPDPFDLQAALFVESASSTLYVGTLDDGVYVSDDAGLHWQRHSQGLEGAALTVWALASAPDAQTLYAGTGAGVYSTTDASAQWQPLGESNLPQVIALAVTPTQAGGEAVYAGTTKGLWVSEYAGQSAAWIGPQAFAYRADVALKEVRVPALLAVGERVYASALGSGIHIGPAQTWPAVETPQSVESLALAEKTLWQWGGRQFYATTERGLYGSDNGVVWASLPLTSVKTIAVDPRHPQVIFAALLPTFDAASSDATSLVTPTSAIMISLNDGQTWRGVGAIPEHVTRLIHSPESHYLFALVTGGGLYRGAVVLPWLWPEVLWGWLLGVIAYGLLVVAPFSYFRLKVKYDLSGAGVRRLLLRPGLLLKLQSQRFRRDLKLLEVLILAVAKNWRFTLVEVWESLDEIGILTSRARLLMALDTLVDSGVLRVAENVFAYPAAEFQRVAAVEFQASADALVTELRREDRLFNDIGAFFDEAEFDVRQDAPTHLTGFVLRPRRALYRPYRRLYAWLRMDGALQGDEVDKICQEIVADEAIRASDRVPIAFFVVTEQPTVEAWQRIRTWRERVQLFPLSLTALRSALRERSSMRDLDRMVQRVSRVTDLYDVRTPVIDWLDFFGRQDALERVEQALDEGHSVAVCGMPAIGKSSFLWHLRDALVNPLVAYVDLLHGGTPLATLQQQIIDDLSRDLWLKYRRSSDAEEADFTAQLAALAELAPGGKEAQARVVLLVDGITDLAMPVFEQLEPVVHLPGVCTVTAWQGSDALCREGLDLGALGAEESTQLITTIGARVGFDFTEDSLARIYHETGGHPKLLRQLGSLLVQKWIIDAAVESATITVESVEQVMPDYVPLRARYFARLWRWLSPDQRSALPEWDALPGAENLQDSLWMQAPALRALFLAWWRTAAEENAL